jgi:cytochrome c peroxidase
MRSVATAFGILGLVTSLAACGSEHGGPDAKAPPAKVRQERKEAPSLGLSVDKAKAHFAPLPTSAQMKTGVKASPALLDLGRQLYFDERLSKNQDLACVSCHDLTAYGVDVRETDGQRNETSLGHRGQLGERNSPTVYNAAFNLAQFWDGRAADLEDQAKGPVLNPVEMAMPDEASVLAVLSSIPGYVEAFDKAFGGPTSITYDNFATAVGAYERGLLTPAPFDDFLRGSPSALDAQQLRGMQLFIDTGCTECHTGVGIGGGSYQKLGNVKAWPDLTDRGRAEISKNPEDEFKFKVPQLRNVAETGPYLHDGSIASLEEMVQKMAVHQLGKAEFAPDDLGAVVAFLRALTGTIDATYTAAPELPPSGPETPAPDPA